MLQNVNSDLGKIILWGWKSLLLYIKIMAKHLQSLKEKRKWEKEKNQKSKIKDLWRRSKGLTSEGLIIWTLGKRHSAHKRGFAWREGKTLSTARGHRTERKWCCSARPWWVPLHSFPKELLSLPTWNRNNTTKSSSLLLCWGHLTHTCKISPKSVSTGGWEANQTMDPSMEH